MATKFISTLTLDKIQVHNRNSPSNLNTAKQPSLIHPSDEILVRQRTVTPILLCAS